MATTSAKDDTGATGKVLSSGKDASSSAGGTGSDGSSLQDAPTSADSPGSSAAGSSSGSGGGGGGSSSGGGGGSVGGSGGGAGVALDPCRACETTRCKIAQPLTTATAKDSRYDAYSVCFSSNPWPGTPGFCAPFDPTSTTAAQGPAMGTPKSDLCQAVLTCVRSSPHMCAATTDFDICYCGDTPESSCIGGLVPPTGDCKSVMEDAAETTDAPTLGGISSNSCGAYGAAYDVHEYCDRPCCPVECQVTTAGPFNKTWCMDPGSAGASGGAGAAGAGSSGGGGAGGASVSSGDNGGGGAGGSVTSYGGSAGTTGAGATGGAGTDGAAGTTDPPGSSTAGTTGAAGANGGADGGAAGASMGGLSSLADNFRFLSNTDDWTASGVNVVATFSADDAEGTGMTGSLQLAQTLGDSSLTTAVAAVQCLPATAGTTFDLDVSVKVPDQTTSRGYIEVVAYPSDFCWGPVHGVYISQQVSAPVWQHVALSAPLQSTGVQSILVQLVTVKLQGHASADAMFDTVLVSEH